MDTGKAAVIFVIIEAVTNHEAAGDVKEGVSGGWGRFGDALGIEENAGFNGGGLVGVENGEKASDGIACVKDIVDEEDMAVMEGEVVGAEDLKGMTLGAAVTDALDNVEGKGMVEVADEVGGEADRSFEDRENLDFTTLIICADLSSGLGDSGRDLFGTEERGQFHERVKVAPSVRRLSM